MTLAHAKRRKTPMKFIRDNITRRYSNLVTGKPKKKWAELSRYTRNTVGEE